MYKIYVKLRNQRGWSIATVSDDLADACNDILKDWASDITQFHVSKDGKMDEDDAAQVSWLYNNLPSGVYKV